ncbi:GNAT family N-acetyltransferase [Nostoc flagelliforme]|uniref:GNAT family N-acetyltransferase n=1 Tax=Nostoc flagelliforme TaxID=1306274 RepID=UPI00142D91E9|nr:GNAT family N-acetyltransferase [Nostoc flagelliforme]
MKLITELTVDEEEALRVLRTAVYPPEIIAHRPGRHIKWSLPQWRLLVEDRSGSLVSHIGIVNRKITLDDVSICIGGIGGVMTSPEAQGQGFATAALGHAKTFLDECGLTFALLVCRHDLVPFYTRLGWQSFNGILLVEQPGGTVPFTVNEPMVLPVNDKAPKKGTINLCGLPW